MCIRDRDTPRLRLRLKKMECPYERQKLDFGDYSAKFRLPTGDWWSLAGRVAVERKMSLDELCQCYTRSRDRFTREFERAAGMGAKKMCIRDSILTEVMKILKKHFHQ